MNLLTVDYNILLYVVIGAFALGGFIRGWWREGLTTVLLMLLVLFLTQPDILTNIIDRTNDILILIGLVTETGGNLSIESVQAAANTAEAPVTIDPANRNFYIILLIVIILVSYFVSRRSLPIAAAAPGTYFEPTMGARILGAVIGAFNGFVVINLFKEYIIGRAIPGTGIASTASAPSTLSLQIAGVPPDTPFAGTAMMLIGAIGLAVLAGTLWSRYHIAGGIKSALPPGYIAVPLAKPPDKK